MTPKQKVFVEEYLRCWNATEAARVASYANPRRQGSRLLTNVDIKEEIERRIAEKVMSADEVLLRLAEQARGDMRDFIQTTDYGGFAIDLDKARKAGKTHLIKSVTSSKNGDKIELYSSQAALVHLGKHHGLFVDRVRVEWKVEIIELLRNNQITPSEVIEELGDDLAIELFEQAGVSIS